MTRLGGTPNGIREGSSSTLSPVVPHGDLIGGSWDQERWTVWVYSLLA